MAQLPTMLSALGYANPEKEGQDAFTFFGRFGFPRCLGLLNLGAALRHFLGLLRTSSDSPAEVDKLRSFGLRKIQSGNFSRWAFVAPIAAAGLVKVPSAAEAYSRASGTFERRINAINHTSVGVHILLVALLR